MCQVITLQNMPKGKDSKFTYDTSNRYNEIVKKHSPNRRISEFNTII